MEVSKRPEISASNMASEAFTPMLQGQPSVSETQYIETSSKWPFKVLQQAILKTISPWCSPNNLDAIINAERKRK